MQKAFFNVENRGTMPPNCGADLVRMPEPERRPLST